LSAGFVNSKVRRVRAQELGAPSREVVKSWGARTTIRSREREDRWIKNPISYHAFGGSEVERTSSQLKKLRSVESRGMEETHGRTIRWGPHDWQVDTRHLERGVNTSLIYHVSEDRNRRARDFNPWIHEGASCKRHWYLNLAGGHTRRALTREGAIPVLTSQVSQDWEGGFKSFNSWTCEIARLRQRTLELGLGHSIVDT
jgi:hypothetical protein